MNFPRFICWFVKHENSQGEYMKKDAFDFDLKFLKKTHQSKQNYKSSRHT